MTKLKSVASLLGSIYIDNTMPISKGEPSEIRWPYTEMIYCITSIIKEIDQVNEHGNFDKDYILEKTNLIQKYCEDINRKLNAGKPDDAPY